MGEALRGPAESLLVRPAVVPARDDDVDLVVRRRAILDLEHPAGLRLEREAERIAVTHRIHERPRRGTHEDRIVGGTAPSPLIRSVLPFGPTRACARRPFPVSPLRAPNVPS